MEIKVISYTNSEMDKLIKTKKVIGKGTEGTCYKVGDKVFKIYHELYDVVSKNENSILDSSGVRIYHKGDNKNFKKTNRPVIDYKDSEGVTLTVKDGLTRAIEKGYKIVGTRLPSSIISVRGRVKGCVYPYYDHTKSIYKSFRKSYKKRLIICKSLITKIQELLDNNIYPIDLCNKSKIKLYDKNDNNVLLDRKNEPIIIDLEGRSTLYTDYKSAQLESKTYYSLILLVLEILTRDVITTPLEEDDLDEVCSILNRFGLPQELIDNIVYDNVSKEDINKVINIADNKIKCK